MGRCGAAPVAGQVASAAAAAVPLLHLPPLLSIRSEITPCCAPSLQTGAVVTVAPAASAFDPFGDYPRFFETHFILLHYTCCSVLLLQTGAAVMCDCVIRIM